MKHVVKLPKDISYNNLLAYVKKKVDAAKGKVNADIRLSYKDGTMSLDIVDDDDVHYFIHDVCGQKDQAQKLFISINSEIRSFIAFMRPLIIIDAAHLKGKYKGTNLLAVGMDGNNQIIPIATGVCQGETGESWTLLLRKLRECIGVVPGLAIISDRHQSIIQACNTVFHENFHGSCCRHLMMNCNLKGDLVRYLFWKSCKAYSVEAFESKMKQLRAKRPHAVKKLEEVGFDKWSRAYCPANRYNYLTSNSAESINALTRLVRKVPITMLMEYYRRLLQDWYCQRREKYIDAPELELTDWASMKVQRRMYKSENWEVRGIALCAVYQVIDHHNSHIVDFLKRECSCRQWQLSGLPCGHVCAVCRSEGLTNCNQWALPWFTKTNLKGTYHEMVFPLPDERNWHNPGNLPKLKPPAMVKQQSGRPKNKDRFPSKNEEPISKQCGRCGCKSHTREACMQPLPKSGNGKQPFDCSGVRKRKSAIEREVIIESNPGNETEVMNNPNMEVDEEYFENGRIYADWEDLDWFGQPSENHYGVDEVGIGEASSSGINLNSYPESLTPYHLDDFQFTSNFN
ncbi:transposase, MuDR, MULE transposase domain protein [Artemisia annua]|uniref:Transposase, MuDR, MULE transposase domain protein n=1 Tax=Artemisia annua TaxID=35608 RepID=A0A2U1Q594_ARTAN|nr:transposase, MuDR, MULE transposase domain protein [Artemisia annua]